MLRVLVQLCAPLDMQGSIDQSHMQALFELWLFSMLLEQQLQKDRKI